MEFRPLHRIIGNRHVTIRYPVFFAALAAASCAAPTSAPPLPPTIGGGLGSAQGNYPSVELGQIFGPEGKPCPVFVWGRPLSDGRVLRLRSASCAFAAHPGGLIAIELSSQIVPWNESMLRDDRP